MSLRLFGRKTQADAAARLYASIVAAARREALYARLGVPDTVDGRFDMIALHAFPVLLQLNKGEPKARAVAQDLADLIFAELDRAFRQMGAGDLSVGKRVRKAAEVFYGRLEAYNDALGRGHDAMAAALRRNIYAGGDGEDHAIVLARHALLACDWIGRQSPEHIGSGALDYPEIEE